DKTRQHYMIVRWACHLATLAHPPSFLKRKARPRRANTITINSPYAIYSNFLSPEYSGRSLRWQALPSGDPAVW
ncbi:14323_t:CDS:1, partial [Acaulospora colombiana]